MAVLLVSSDSVEGGCFDPALGFANTGVHDAALVTSLLLLLSGASAPDPNKVSLAGKGASAG